MICVKLRPRNMTQLGQFRLIGHNPVADQLVEPDRQRHQSGHAGDATHRRLRHYPSISGGAAQVLTFAEW